MRVQRVVGHQLLRNLFCERRFKATTNVDGRQLLVLTYVVGLEFLPLKIEVGLLGIRLRVNRHILAGGHRHRSGNQSGDSRDQHAAVTPVRRGDSEHQARSGEDTVVGAQYGRAQPTDAPYAVPFS